MLSKAGWLMFYLYIILLSYFLFFSEKFGRGTTTEGYRYNLELFLEIKRFYKYREQVGFGSFLINILGNVIAFMPFGYLLPLLNRKYRRFFYVLFNTIIFSLAVEAVQMLTQVGIFDVDDIFLNTIGGVLGYLIFAISYKIYQSFHRNTGKRRGR